MRKCFFLPVFLLFFVFQVGAQDAPGEGALLAVSKKGARLGACPLKKTAVKAEISGFLARVTVAQEFENSFAEPIEAVYTFPLSQTGAVDEMTMRIGERTIRGRIMKREEARKVYEQARTEGKTAALLDQQRPNIFTQAVANILPGEKILVEISYVETLKYADGQYEFVFPMTIAPRYSPASVIEAETARVAPVIAETRAGHNISIEVNLNAGVPVEEIRSGSHEIQTLNLSTGSARITLAGGETIPNKDFILRYDVTGKRIEDALLTHRAGDDGFFTLILSPPDRFGIEDVTSKEIVFVLDSSGSMSGFPIEKAKEAINLSLDGLYPNDTFNLITFAGDTSVLFDQPVPATQANIERAREFLKNEGAGGGTEMMKAIRASLAPTDSQEHLRIVCFMTDGLVGNEDEIIAEVRKHPRARVFSFGIGDSVNRYLLDNIAQAGRGEAEYISPSDDGSKAARQFYERVRTPLLTDLSIDWNGLPVTDVYPRRINDLFSAKPVILHGRYARAASGTIRLKGLVGGQEMVREIAVKLPEAASENNVLATLWARTKIGELLGKDMRYDADEQEQYIDLKTKTKLDVTALGLKYNLLTPFTSFVAVEEQIKTSGGKTKKVVVPVETPEGMKRLDQTNLSQSRQLRSSPIQPSSNDPYGFIFQMSVGRRSNRGGGSGIGYGSGSGSGNGSSGGYTARSFSNVDSVTLTVKSPSKVISGGVMNGRALTLVKPPYPATARAANVGGTVTVQVLIDEKGDVVSATAVSGHPLLRARAVEAARNSKFAPVLFSGQPVRVTGVIVYNFILPNYKVEPKVGELQAEQLSPEQKAEKERLETANREEQDRIENEKLAEQARLEEERLVEQARREKEARYRSMIAEKLHFWVFAVYERLQKGEFAPAETEAKFIREGKADIEIRLTAKTPAALEKLRRAGFEIASEDKTQIVYGKISIEKFAQLAEIAEVRYVFPHLK